MVLEPATTTDELRAIILRMFEVNARAEIAVDIFRSIELEVPNNLSSLTRKIVFKMINEEKYLKGHVSREVIESAEKLINMVLNQVIALQKIRDPNYNVVYTDKGFHRMMYFILRKDRLVKD